MPSTVISAISYDASSSVLTVTYISGMVYKYKNVPGKVFKELTTSTSKGRYLNFHVKRKYEFEKA